MAAPNFLAQSVSRAKFSAFPMPRPAANTICAVSRSKSPESNGINDRSALRSIDGSANARAAISAQGDWGASIDDWNVAQNVDDGRGIRSTTREAQMRCSMASGAMALILVINGISSAADKSDKKSRCDGVCGATMATTSRRAATARAIAWATMGGCAKRREEMGSPR